MLLCPTFQTRSVSSQSRLFISFFYRTATRKSSFSSSWQCLAIPMQSLLPFKISFSGNGFSIDARHNGCYEMLRSMYSCLVLSGSEHFTRPSGSFVVAALLVCSTLARYLLALQFTGASQWLDGLLSIFPRFEFVPCCLLVLEPGHA